VIVESALPLAFFLAPPFPPDVPDLFFKHRRNHFPLSPPFCEKGSFPSPPSTQYSRVFFLLRGFFFFSQLNPHFLSFPSQGLPPVASGCFDGRYFFFAVFFFPFAPMLHEASPSLVFSHHADPPLRSLSPAPPHPQALVELLSARLSPATALRMCTPPSNSESAPFYLFPLSWVFFCYFPASPFTMECLFDPMKDPWFHPPGV